MTDIDPLDLTALRAYAHAALERAEKAAPGLWDYDPDDEEIFATYLDEHLGISRHWIADCMPPYNGPFIAAARLDVPNLAASVLTLAAKLEQAWAENAAHVLDMARLAEALDPLREIVAYGSVNNDPRLWTEVRD